MDKIVQADRDEAARTGLAIGLPSGVDALNVQQGGVWDEWTLVQAFARHRLSHTPQSVEPVAIHVAALVEALQVIQRETTAVTPELENLQLCVGTIHSYVTRILAPFTKGPKP